MELEKIKDALANEHYSTPYWMLLNEHQQAMLVDLVATEYALAQVKKMSETTLNLFNQ